MSDSRPLTPGYRLNSATVLRDLHRLLSAFTAIAPIRELSTGEDDPLLQLHDRFVDDEIVHLLVSTATMNRLHLEHMRQLRDDPDELSFQPLDATCGQLHPNSGSEENRPLEFREACNKIIHADVVELFDPERPVLRLMGRLGGQEWLALVELVDYVRASFRNFEDALG